ncbi:FAD-dependent oxidoreductase [Desulfoscipio sp. XC116]|uniref:NAD(P)/FAD-dependent oxidoreductase n=1 Tax=Desulfoscipio sp. XC116 TaxID=3144975 RepID=UPI00325BB113
MSMQADIIIIGAGVIGLSTAYHLACRKDNLRIVILEKEKFHGAGSTAQCTGGIRYQFTNPVNIQLTKISYPHFLRFAATMQYPIYFRRRGYLLVTGKENRRQELHNIIEQLNRLEVPARLLAPKDIAAAYPFVLTEDLLEGSFCPPDAYADPYGVMEGYYRQCRGLGVQVLCNTEVTGIKVRSNRVAGVLCRHTRQDGRPTEEDTISAPAVINAAGPHLHLLARLAGLALPAAPYRRQVYVCAHMPAIPADIPLIVDLDTGFYMHAEKNGILLLGGTDHDSAPGLETVVDRSRLSNFIESAIGRVPVLEDAQITRIYTGIRSLTPDGLGILGETEINGFYCAGGFGGNGFMHAPAIGLITSCLILGEQPPLDPAPLSPNRFNNAPIAESALF